MSRSEHIRLMATYNEWMNAKLYNAAKTLPAEEIAADRKAFFGSILGTLNHLVVADTIWLKRFATHPAHYRALEPMHAEPMPSTHLDPLPFGDLESLSERRLRLDALILGWAEAVEDRDFDHVLCYTSTRGVPYRTRFFDVVMHFFNHQTHHRGQTSTLFSQAGVDIGVTDLLVIVPNDAA